MNRRRFLALAFLMPARPAPADISIIAVRHRRAQDLLPVLRPLLGPGDALTASGGDLVLRADPATAREIEALARRLDRPPVELLITVRRIARRHLSGNAVRGGVNLEAGDLRLGVDRPVEGGVAARARAHASTMEGAREQAVRTLEGRPVLLRGAGELEATVRLPGGEGVHLTIRSLGRPGETALDTVVTGRLGQWITLGGVGERRTRHSAGLLEHARGRHEDEDVVQVRVDRVNP